MMQSNTRRPPTSTVPLPKIWVKTGGSTGNEGRETNKATDSTSLTGSSRAAAHEQWWLWWMGEKLKKKTKNKNKQMFIFSKASSSISCDGSVKSSDYVWRPVGTDWKLHQQSWRPQHGRCQNPLGRLRESIASIDHLGKPTGNRSTPSPDDHFDTRSPANKFINF